MRGGGGWGFDSSFPVFVLTHCYANDAAMIGEASNSVTK